MSDHLADDAADDAGWNESAASSVNLAQRGQIKMFCSVTGADADSALHVLEAHNWDMDRSVMFFMEPGAPAPQSRPLSTAAAPEPVQHTSESAIEVDEDRPPLQQQRPSEAVAPPYQHEVRRLPLSCADSHILTTMCLL